jgi:RND family efflux transporter MFP subunit
MRVHWPIAGLALLSLPLASCLKPGSAKPNATTDDSAPTVAVERAARADLSRSLTLTAEFIPFQEVEVMSKVAGYIKKINVDIGDRVHTGQVLAILEVPEMNDDLARAAAGVQRSEAEVKRAQGDLERAQASHEIAHLASERLQGVAKTRPGLVAQQEIDDARGKDLASEAQVAAAQSTLQANQQQTAVSRAEQARFKTMYNYTSVVAPFDGVVTMRYGNTGAMIQAGTSSQSQAMPVVRLSQNTLLRLMLPVPESAVSRIRMGQQVEVKVPSLESRSFTGKIARFTNKVTTATRTMETEVDVPNPKLILIPGMYASVDLRLENRPGVLSIPVAAADATGAEPRVFKVTAENTIDVVPVKLGLETSSRVEVLSGLKEGDAVVVGARAGLKPGDRVKPQIVSIGAVRAQS